jgi:ATP-dependent Clp protease ATP-binding subunit ClpB
VGAGAAEGAQDAANMLKPALARGELQCIGATTLDEYRKHVEKDKALERRFQPVYVGEPSVEDTIAILRGIKEKYEVHHGIRIRDAALVAAARLSQRYVTARFLPDKAIDLIDEAASRLKMEIESTPTPIDDLERQITRLEVERQAMAMEKSDRAEARGEELGTEIWHLRETVFAMRARWQRQRDLVLKSKGINVDIDALRTEAEIAQRRGELQPTAHSAQVQPRQHSTQDEAREQQRERDEENVARRVVRGRANAKRQGDQHHPGDRRQDAVPALRIHQRPQKRAPREPRPPRRAARTGPLGRTVSRNAQRRAFDT